MEGSSPAPATAAAATTTTTTTPAATSASAEGAAPMDSLATCLLQWVHTFSGAAAHVESLAELSDGLALWGVLGEVDAAYFAEPLPEPAAGNDWTRRWQNLRHLERQVSTYFRDVCNGQQEQRPRPGPDLKAIAAEGAVGELEKLVMMILRAAMASPLSNQKMVARLMSMGKENATVIATELRNMEEEGEEGQEEGEEEEEEEEEEEDYVEERSGSRGGSAREEQEGRRDGKANGAAVATAGLYEDPLLEREQELLQAQDTIAKLQHTQNAALRQIQELRQDKDRLQEAFDAYRNEIDTKGRRTGGDDAFKKLQRQAENDRAYIDDLENQLQSSRNTLDNYERQLQRHREENEAAQKLRDDLQMLRSDNEDLQQKMKANENLKKKIQTLQEQEKANLSLREELKQANERLEDLERLKQVQAGLEKEIIEKKGLIRNQEYQINELATMRKHAEFDARALAQKLTEARERQDRDHEAIQELQGRLQEANLDDTVDIETSEEQEKTVPAPSADGDLTPSVPKTDDSKHMADKLALMEQQLVAADARLKQAAERNAALEDKTRDASSAAAEGGPSSSAKTDEYERTIAELKKELQAAQKQKAEAMPQDARAVQRENHLMTTAWYDLSSRLQNNGVSLGRRRQEPKSWIGKQRALVGPGRGPAR